MRITLLAVGKKMPSWIDAGYQEYARRLTGPVRLELQEVAQIKEGSGTVVRDKEGQKLIQSIPRNNKIVALDVKGESWDTPTLAKQLENWKGGGQDVCLLIGGPEGLSADCLANASQRWSLSNLTFPHPLVRLLVVEQLYRAESILNGHPYHRA